MILLSTEFTKRICNFFLQESSQSVNTLTFELDINILCSKVLNCFLHLHFHSVEKLIEIGRHHIECSSKIQYEMTLEETDFFLSSDVKVIPDPVPPPHVPQVETSDSGTLTISQLNTFHKQFLQVAPKGKKKKNLLCSRKAVR